MPQTLNIFIKAFLSSVLLCCLTTVVQAETGFLGMQVQVITPHVLDALGREQKGGMLIRDVALDEPADRAGIHRGDLLIAIDGKPVVTMKNLIKLLSTTQPDQAINLTVIRLGKELKLALKLGTRSPSWGVSEDKVVHLPQNGLTLVSITPKIRKQFKVRWGLNGVLVSLSNAKVGSEDLLVRGDIIVQVNQVNIWSPDQIVQMYKDAFDQGRKSLLLLVDRPSGSIFITLLIKR